MVVIAVQAGAVGPVSFALMPAGPLTPLIGVGMG